jgi:hypothetical protein
MCFEAINLVSISPTFYEKLLCMKVTQAAFLYLHFRFVLFWRKNTGAKAAHKMLVKLTPNDVHELQQNALVKY